MAENVSMIGYTRVSRADGRQAHDLQCDVLIAAGVDPKRIRWGWITRSRTRPSFASRAGNGRVRSDTRHS